MNLQQAMRQATAEILSDPKAVVYCGPKGKPGYRPTRPYDINCGFCEEWANRVAELVPEAEVIGVDNLTGNSDDALEYPHVFLRYKGKFYDAETTQGTSDWKNLPALRKDVVDSKATAIVNRLLEVDPDAPTPENIERLTPVVNIEDLYNQMEKHLGLENGWWQWYTNEQGVTTLIITGFAFQYRTSGEAYRAVLEVLDPLGIKPVEFMYDEDDHGLTVWLPKHHVQAPPPTDDNSDDTGIANPNSWFNQP